MDACLFIDMCKQLNIMPEIHTALKITSLNRYKNISFFNFNKKEREFINIIMEVLCPFNRGHHLFQNVGNTKCFCNIMQL